MLKSSPLCGKHEIRMSKSETMTKHEIRIFKTLAPRQVSDFGFSRFEFVSNFDIRISNFPP